MRIPGENKYETSMIEVTVRGEVGCGKSEALEVIANALREFYHRGSKVVVAGKVCEGAIEEAKFTKQSARFKPAVFVLYEKTPNQD